MPDHIPDLWPEEITSETVSPVTILKIQATKLAEKTSGVLEGDVTTSSQESKGARELTHTLDIVAPALDNRRERVVTLKHLDNLYYPVEVSAVGIDKPGTADSEQSLLQMLRLAFSSRQVLSIIYSLIAKSNEIRPHLQGSR